MKKLTFTAFLVMALLGSLAGATEYYWLGGSGSWNNLNLWGNEGFGGVLQTPTVLPSASDWTKFTAAYASAGTVTTGSNYTVGRLLLDKPNVTLSIGGNFSTTSNLVTLWPIYATSMFEIINGAMIVDGSYATSLAAGSDMGIGYIGNSEEYPDSNGLLKLKNGATFSTAASGGTYVRIGDMSDGGRPAAAGPAITRAYGKLVIDNATANMNYLYGAGKLLSLNNNSNYGQYATAVVARGTADIEVINGGKFNVNYLGTGEAGGVANVLIDGTGSQIKVWQEYTSFASYCGSATVTVRNNADLSVNLTQDQFTMGSNMKLIQRFENATNVPGIFDSHAELLVKDGATFSLNNSYRSYVFKAGYIRGGTDNPVNYDANQNVVITFDNSDFVDEYCDFQLNRAEPDVFLSEGATCAAELNLLNGAVFDVNSLDASPWGVGSAEITLGDPNVVLHCDGNFKASEVLTVNYIFDAAGKYPTMKVGGNVEFFDSNGLIPDRAVLNLDFSANPGISIGNTFVLIAAGTFNANAATVKVIDSAGIYTISGMWSVNDGSVITDTATYPNVYKAVVDKRAADINGDGKTDLLDFAILANQWQQAPGTPSADIAPQGGDGIVDIEDLLVLTRDWLTGTD